MTTRSRLKRLERNREQAARAKEAAWKPTPQPPWDEDVWQRWLAGDDTAYPHLDRGAWNAFCADLVAAGLAEEDGDEVEVQGQEEAVEDPA
jgi:hypothetical protein